MNIKEAMDDLYICATGAKYNTPTLGVGYYEKCWETVLNELDKKDKVIDMMAEQIRASDIDEDICKLITEPTECVSRDCKCEKCIKEYFYNKVEIPEKN